MNEKIMEKVLDFLEDKKHTVVRMCRRYIKMARPRRPRVDVCLMEYEYDRKKYAKRHNQTLAQTLRLEVEKMIALLQTPIDSFCLL